MHYTESFDYFLSFGKKIVGTENYNNKKTYILHVVLISASSQQLITPEEMVNPNCDELSMMTYLSQYPNSKLKSGAPLRPRTNPGR